MDPVAPDWRSIGDAPAPGAPRERSRVALSPARQATWVVAGLLAALVFGAAIALALMPSTGGVTIDTLAADQVGGAPVDDVVAARSIGRTPGTIEQTLLVVDVEGAVARPGLVRVPAGGRVGDAVRIAGGFAADADLAAAADALNLAQQVTDGLKVVVPAIGDARSTSGVGLAVADPAGGAGTPIDLNRATESALDALPGVGPATIAKIVAARAESPFRSVDELRSRGIVGEATFAKLRDLVTVGG
jgi:competence protein ComEA